MFIHDATVIQCHHITSCNRQHQ